jgi:DUF1009 family protein
MLALIAGTGDLPPALLARLADRPLVCAMAGFQPTVTPDVTFRIEQLGSFLQDLTARGVTEVCMAGAVRRPPIEQDAIDAATMPLVPRLIGAIAKGDDGALREVIAILEEAGLAVKAAHEIAPDLLPPEGVLTKTVPSDWHKADAAEGEACVAAMGVADTGQACIVRLGRVMATEDVDGTDVLMTRFFEPYKKTIPDDPLTYLVDLGSDLVGAASDWLSGETDDPITADDGILFKAPKPTQDRRADLPLIGPSTAMGAAEAGLSGIVIEAGGVLVLNLPGVIEILDAQSMFLWVRPKGGA